MNEVKVDDSMQAGSRIFGPVECSIDSKVGGEDIAKARLDWRW